MATSGIQSIKYTGSVSYERREKLHDALRKLSKLIDSKRESLSSDFWLEALDPNHHHAPFLKGLLPYFKPINSEISFWEFVSRNPNEALNKDLWLTPSERRPYQARPYQSRVADLVTLSRRTLQREPFIEGPFQHVFYDAPLIEGKYKFVLDKDALYVTEDTNSNFSHASFLGGSAVDSAGTLTFSEGLVTEVSLHSGHYKPKYRAIYPILQWLKTNEIFQQPIRVSIYQELTNGSLKVIENTVSPGKAHLPIALWGDLSHKNEINWYLSEPADDDIEEMTGAKLYTPGAGMISEGEFDFVLSESELFLEKGAFPITNQKLPTLVKNIPTSSSGQLRFEKGEIVKINLFSRYFKPTKDQIYPILNWAQKRDLFAKEVIVILPSQSPSGRFETEIYKLSARHFSGSIREWESCRVSPNSGR